MFDLYHCGSMRVWGHHWVINFIQILRWRVSWGRLLASVSMVTPHSLSNVDTICKLWSSSIIFSTLQSPGWPLNEIQVVFGQFLRLCTLFLLVINKNCCFVVKLVQLCQSKIKLDLIWLHLMCGTNLRRSSLFPITKKLW